MLDHFTGPWSAYYAKDFLLHFGKSHQSMTILQNIHLQTFAFKLRVGFVAENREVLGFGKMFVHRRGSHPCCWNKWAWCWRSSFPKASIFAVETGDWKWKLACTMWVNPYYSPSLKYHHSAAEVLQTNWHEPPSLSAPDLTYHVYILMYLHGFCWDKASERISLHITPLYPSNGHSEPPTPVNPES